MITRILVLALSILPALTIACSCLYSTSFCENINQHSNVVGVRIINGYFGLNSDHYIDVELVDEILGEAPATQMTFLTGHGTSCDPFPGEFVPGDTIIVHIVHDFNDPPNWSGYSLSAPCSSLYIIPSSGGDGFGYQEFIDEIDDCVEDQFFFEQKTIEELTIIYPNPVITDLNIVSLANVDLQVKIYASNGAVVAAFDFNQNMDEPLNVSNWARGLYFIRFETPEGAFVRKFVKG